MTVRQPRLLDANLKERARLYPVKLALTRRLSVLSTAELTLRKDAPEIALRDFIELYDQNGSAGVFRVKEIVENIGQTRVLTLEHALGTLRDSVIPVQGFMCPVAEAFSRLLAHQSEPRWAMGDVDAPEDLTIIFATEYANLLDALNILLDMLPDGYTLDYDQSVTPWLLHLRPLPEEAACEGRLTRNLKSVRCQVDGSRLCTRLYPFGVELDTGRISLVPVDGSDHVQSDAADTLGVISHTFENDLIFDSVTLSDVALMYLDRHAEPEALITVDALDLSVSTGEAIDAFHLGKLCRLCLPDHGLTVCERIVAIHQADVYGAPDQMTVTLSNRLRQQTEEDEIAMLVRQVTAGKLLGGTVVEIRERNFARGAVNDPIAHFFDLSGYAAVLDVRVQINPSPGVSLQAVRVDAALPPADVWRSGSFSLMPYLARDELGQIARSQHQVLISPTNGVYGELCGVESYITMTVIENTTT